MGLEDTNCLLSLLAFQINLLSYYPLSLDFLAYCLATGRSLDLVTQRSGEHYFPEGLHLNWWIKAPSPVQMGTI